ncbi:MAG: hypothetical protein Q8Q60_01390 [Candidatus Chromulinivorax sp.]|nr:hypothetical protein [Candidatus Chromulinivorax sp.]
MNFNTGKICLLLAMLIAYTSTMSCSHSPSGIRNRAFSNPETQNAWQKYQQRIYLSNSSQNLCPPNSPKMSLLQAFPSQPPILEGQTNSPEKIKHLCDVPTSDLPALTIQIPTNSSDNDVTSPYPNLRRVRAISNDWSSSNSDEWSMQDNASPSSQDLIAEREKTATIIHMDRVQNLLQQKLEETVVANIQIKYRLLQAASVVLPIVTIATKFLGDEPNDQTRFGVAAAATVISLLPTILTTLVGVYGVWKLDRMLHAEERAAIANLKHAIQLENQKRDKESAEEFKKLYTALNKETAARKTGDIDSINNIVTLTTDLKQKLLKVVDDYQAASNKLGDALETVAEVKKINEYLLANYPHMMKKLDEILHHTSKMSRNMEGNDSNNYVDTQLDNIEYFLNNSNNNEESSDAQAPTDKKISSINPNIQRRRALSQTKTSTDATQHDLTSSFPAGTPVTPSGHASPAVFTKSPKNKGGILNWVQGYISEMKQPAKSDHT